MTQPCVVASGTAQIPAKADPELLRGWLLKIFLVPAHYLERFDAVHRTGDDDQQRVERILALGTILSNALLRQSGIPLFDNGKVLSVARVPGAQESDPYQFTVALPAYDRVPAAIIVNSFANTLRLMTDRMTGKAEFDSIAPVLDQLYEKAIKPIAKTVHLTTDGVASTFTTWKTELPERPLGNGLKRVGWGARSRLMKISAVQSDAAIASTMCKNKAHTAAFLRGLGLPAAQHAVVETEEKALAAAREMGWPLVIKPASAERSMGVCIDISDEQTVKTAFAEAQTYSRHVLVEKRVPGYCYRIAICGDTMLFARAHRPKGVIGDGKLTVSELADKATKTRGKAPPWLAKKPFAIDDLARETLRSDGLTPETVAPKGEFVRLRPIIRDDWGAEFETLTDRIHPDNVDAARLACKAMGLTMAGVDMITPDIAKPWHETGAIINEINYMPQVLKDVDDAARAVVARAVLGGEGDGRIAVHFVTGKGDLDRAAVTLRQSLKAKGEACHVIGRTLCEDADGTPVRSPEKHETLFEATLALLARPDVEGLIIAAPPDVFAKSGWPVDRLARVHLSQVSEAEARTIWQAIDARIPTLGFKRLKP